MKDDLNVHALVFPLKQAFAVLEQLVQRKTYAGGSNHDQINDGHLVNVLCEQPSLAHAQRVARLFQVAQRCGKDHDGQGDPEEDEEASEVGIL